MDKTISIYWFAILILVAIAVVYMVSAFYGAPYDIRENEAGLLTNRIADCLSYKGEISSFLFNSDGSLIGFNNDFEEKCGIILSAEDTWKDPQYYLYVGFFSIENLDESVYFFETGNLNLIPSCEVQKDKEFEKLARCVEKRFYSTRGDKQYLIKILSTVRKTEKNVK